MKVEPSERLNNLITVATLPGVKRHGISGRTRRPGDSILCLDQTVRLICNFIFRVEASVIILVVPSLTYSLHLGETVRKLARKTK